MNNQKFSIEISKELIPNYVFYLHKLYLPLIGPNATILYELLIDLCDNNFFEIYLFNYLSKSILLDINEIDNALANLEAVGLIDRYIKNDDSHMVITINNPLNIEKFNKNILLKNHLIKKIGIEAYEKIFFSNKRKSFNKANYIKVSKKYQDVFVSDFESHLFNESETSSIYSTMDLDVSSFATHDENIEKLPASHFIKYLLKRNPLFDENMMISHLLKLGYNDATINLFIDFCVNQNNKIVKNYILKIAEDFISRSLVSFKDVKNELNSIAIAKKSALNKKVYKSIFNSHNKINSINNEINEINFNDVKSYDEIFENESKTNELEKNDDFLNDIF